MDGGDLTAKTKLFHSLWATMEKAPSQFLNKEQRAVRDQKMDTGDGDFC